MNDPKTSETQITPLESLSAQPAGDDCLVMIYPANSKPFGKRFVLREGRVGMGRGSENQIVLDMDIVSRNHCELRRHGLRWHLVDLGSTNGTYVNDEIIEELALRQGDLIKVGDTIFKYLSGSDVEAQYHETIYRMTIMDGLTDVHNKRYLMEALEREIPRARRHERPLALLMIDIDHFKKINDEYGHLAGDWVLKEIAQAMRARLRPDDILARYGGEEFVVMLPETPLEGAIHIAEDLRGIVERRVLSFEGESIRASISIGVAVLEKSWDALTFVRSADEYLYAAKNSGRNRVRYASKA